jgi:H+/Cl- antiporter ClcA
MNKYNIKKPYGLFWLVMPIIVVLGILKKNQVFSIEITDLYFELPFLQFGIFLAIFCGFLGFCYWLFRNKRLQNRLALIHVLVTLALVLFLMIRFGTDKMEAVDVNVFRPTADLRAYYEQNELALSTLVFFVSAQLVLVVNICLFLFKKSDK